MNVLQRKLESKTRNSLILFRPITLALCAIIIAASLISSIFTLTHAVHKHDNDGVDGACAVCILLATVENLSKQIPIAITVITIAYIALSASAYKPAFLNSESYTLIALKVRLNN